MEVNIHPSWKKVLSYEFEKPEFKKLIEFVEDEYKSHTCFPPKENIFEAFNRCPFDDIKIVIIGQDPYHGANQAHGLCFSVNDGVPFPPSLRNIFKEIAVETGAEIPSSGNLGRWADQGVFLINSILTVREGKANSHKDSGWAKFTDQVIKLISDKKENVVFMLWGGLAKKKGIKIDRTKHLVLESGHPSPFSAMQKKWFDNMHFTKANEYLKSKRITPIEW